MTLNQVHRANDLTVFHSIYLPDACWLGRRPQTDHDLRAGASDMHVCWTVLAGWQQDVHGEAALPDDLGHGNITYQMGFSAEQSGFCPTHP